MTGYIFDNAAEQSTAQRFAGLETLYDSRTRQLLTATGVGSGWHCYEVGAGGGSIAAWLAERVGPDGHVLATDLDPRFLNGLAEAHSPQLDVRRHDVTVDPIPEAAFDLIHARLVLLHLPAAPAVLGRLVAALRPGGWMVVEDFDPTFVDRAFPVSDPAEAGVARRVFRSLGELLEKRGAGAGWARNLHAHFVAAGFVDIGADGYFEIRTGGSPGARVDAANLTQVRETLAGTEELGAEDVDRLLALLEEPEFTYSSPAMFSAWGRRPGQGNRDSGGASSGRLHEIA